MSGAAACTARTVRFQSGPMHSIDRRSFLRASALGSAAVATSGLTGCFWPRTRAVPFQVSLAQWSLHKSHQSGELDPLAFPRKAREFGIDAVEYVNSFYRDKVAVTGYLAELRNACDSEGVRSLLVMCDGEGQVGDPDASRRRQTVENHKRWMEAAAFLGCHSIRVNAGSSGSREEQAKLCVDGLSQLAVAAEPYRLSVLVENHGGLSSDGSWLRGVLAATRNPRVGSLPDFGNFRVGTDEEYDRYQGVSELMPFAKAVSAKSHDFDEKGEESRTDYHRMMRIVVMEHGYRGYVGIEYEGSNLAEDEGIRATQRLLQRIQGELA